MKNPDPDRGRWTSSDGLARAKRVMEALMGSDRLASLGLGVVNGRIDLRGFVVPSPVEVATIAAEGTGTRLAVMAGVVGLSNLVLKGVDLTGASLAQVGLTGSEFEDCLFEEADCRGMRVFGTVFRDCSFARADLRDAALGVTRSGRRTEYERVRFESADLRAAHAIEAHFRDCDFSHARLEGANFMGSSFDRCTFAGKVEDVVFYGPPPAIALESGHDGSMNRMAGVDFRNAVLRVVTFRGVELKEAKLPDDDRHIVLRPYKKLLEKVVAGLREDGSPPAKRLLFMFERGDLKWALDDQDTGIIQLESYHDDEKALLRKLIEQARAST